MLGTLEDPEETFNCETLKAAEKCIREHPRSRSDMLSQGWLGTRSDTGLGHDGLEPFEGGIKTGMSEVSVRMSRVVLMQMTLDLSSKC